MPKRILSALALLLLALAPAARAQSGADTEAWIRANLPTCGYDLDGNHSYFPTGLERTEVRRIRITQIDFQARDENKGSWNVPWVVVRAITFVPKADGYAYIRFALDPTFRSNTTGEAVPNSDVRIYLPTHEELGPRLVKALTNLAKLGGAKLTDADLF